MMRNDKSVFCSLPFTYAFIDSVNEYKLCSDATLGSGIKSNQMSIIEYFNSDYLKNIRDDMIDYNMTDQIKKICHNCIEREKIGLWSRRTQDINSVILDNYKAGNINIPTSDTLKLKFGNLCNLACMTCGPYSSSRWIPLEEKTKKIKLKLYDKFKKMVDNATAEKYKDNFKPNYKSIVQSFNFTEDFYKEFHILSRNIRQIVISGGEPFINDNFYFFIQWLIDNSYAQNINLSVFTNGMKMPKNFKRFYDKFKSFNIRLSIDGIGKKDEYLRKGTDFRLKKSNIDLYYKYFNIDFFVTVNILNVGYLDELKKFSSDYKNSNLHFNYLVDPFFLNGSNLPLEIKQIYINKDIKNRLLNIDGDVKHFIIGILYFKLFDQEYNTNLLDEWPEFEKYYNWL